MCSSDLIGGGGPVTLLTDGRDVYGRTSSGEMYNLLRDPLQPLLMVAGTDALRELSALASKRRRKKPPSM